MKRGPVAAIVLLLSLGCSTSNRISLGEALTSDTDLQRMVDAVLKGKARVVPGDLSDERRVAPSVVLRVPVNGQPTQYTVNTVSEAALCLLEVREKTSTSAILAAAGTNFPGCGANACEVCRSGMQGVREDVKRELVRYWAARLRP